MPTCSGCNVTFPTVHGLTTHLQRTVNPQCLALFRRASAYLPSLDDGDSDGDSEPFGMPAMDTQPVAFAGDFFGANYTEEDFNMLDEATTVMPLDSDDDSDSDDSCSDDFRHGDNWEPPPPPRSPSPTGAFLQRPTIVTFQDAYPGSLAGAPIPTMSAPKSGYLDYKTQFGTNGGTNIWVPFKSQLDWEVAKWAKLRGPGSTAFTELLKLRGIIGSRIAWLVI
ncbi:hypothetical protein BD779DRAFT_1469782 [Infundibulicybe gibba]|nr:hypothetical protein BD779DRAFT_1469782 [Infundibulicybe gibba]